MKILVVEDDPRLGEQIIETLESTGWVPELSQDGIELCIARLRKNGTPLFLTSACQNWMVLPS